MSDISERFELLIFEDAEAYLKRKAVEKVKLRREVEKYKRKVEKKGVCEGCGNGYYDEEKLRWVHNDECYVCQECFMNDLQCQADAMVPMHSAETIDGYDEYLNWDDSWEEEQEEKKQYCINNCKFSKDVHHGDYFCDFHECPLEDVIIELCEKRNKVCE